MTNTRQAVSIVAAFAFAATFVDAAHSQTADDLKNDHLTPGDVLVYGMGYSGQRYSPLNRINK
jgi:alcohol dehydrogenase (cytochrome c)